MPRSNKLNEQMRQESWDKILAAAIDLFSRQGFFNVRMADIARQAGMSSGNIYWYFASKELLLQTILGEYFSKYAAMLRQAGNLPGNGLARLTFLIEGQLAELKCSGAQAQIFMSVLGHGGPELLASLGFDTREIGMEYHQLLQGILVEAMQDGSLPRQDPAVLAVCFFSLFNGLMVTYANDWQRLPEEQLILAVLRLLGVATPDQEMG